ncbi:inactive TPR repeat-containing thioredoxin TTL3-like [Prunus yedoensis var. nudiflora]|uniref:Inactive TPR repeat-containing thioredoxin TTL3-like n=1 Tax=Prunus yedoensis var. nudiflora TaxID=2094558 RepID=A0A314Z7R0_PRUYE|nr:inactive TPR repeat-containing thioredoxin TTL3-like [Prunus yedoensis var. nudiflora]
MEECLQAIKCDTLCSRAHHRLGILYTRHRKACKGTTYLLIIETQINLYLGRFEQGVLTAEKAVDLDTT